MSYPYYRFFPGDYLRDTRGLTFAQHGAYRLLLDLCYTTGKPLAGSDAEIAREVGARTKAEQRAVSYILVKYFTRLDDKWSQKRAAVELSTLALRSAQASDSARKRWSERNANAYANASNQHSKPEPEPELDKPKTLQTSNNTHARAPKSSEKENSKGNGRWHETPEGIDAKGQELGMSARPGEEYHAYKSRIFAKIHGREP